MIPFLRHLPRLSLLLLSAFASAAEPRVGAGTEYDGITLDAAAVTIATSLPATVAIDGSRVLKPISTDLLGIGISGRECDDQFMDRDVAGIAAEMRALLPALPLHLVRIVQYNDASVFGASWDKAIGPAAQRPPIRFNAWEKPAPNHAGPVELVAAMTAADPAVRFVWTVDVRAADQEALAGFLVGPAVGGGPWAERRVAAGRRDPVPVVLWELGNEVDWASKEHALDIDAYVARCRLAIAAIRRVQPGARFAAHLATAPWAYQDRFHRDWRIWHRTLLKELGPDLAHLAFHPYYYGYPTSVIESYMDAVAEDIQAITGEDRISLYISEHGLWPNAAAGAKWETAWWKTHGIPGCLATAQFLNRVAARRDVGPVTYHNLSAGPWGLVYRGATTGRLYTTGIADLFGLYGETLGDAVVEARMTGEQTDPHRADCSLTVLATRTAEGLGVILVNRLDATRRALSLSFADGTYDLVSAATLTAASATARNTEHERQITVERQTTPVPALAGYDLPPRAVVALRLRRR